MLLERLPVIILLALIFVATIEGAAVPSSSRSGLSSSLRLWGLDSSSASNRRVLTLRSLSTRALSPPPSITVNGAACGTPPPTVIVDPGIARRFRTPGYPSDYPNGVSCGWEFVAYNGRPLDMRCDSVTLEENDFLRLHDVSSDADQALPPSPPTCFTTTTTSAPECQCGAKLDSRIVGGQPATADEYPWMVSLGVGTGGQFCGGTLISNSWIVTAAHCIDDRLSRNPGMLQVGLGYYRLSSPLSSSIKRTARQIIRHSRYNDATLENDIALIRVDPIDWAENPTIRPVCLPDNSNDLYSGSTGIVTGWGTLSSDGSSSDTLIEVSIPIISNSACKNDLGDSITSVMLCAGQDAGGVDSCQGDSGGPMVVMDGSNAELVGVVSWGYGCGEPRSPGVYTRVTEFVSWIQTTTSSSDFCPRT
ncbi:Serine proteases trypsin domain [Trinorchestia longiramus]|nr:Serine proteases trypsin domain [Trinorchestia longiramus]